MHYVTPSRFIGFCVVEWSEILHAFAQFLMTFVSQAFNFHSRLLFDAIGTVARLRDTKEVYSRAERNTPVHTNTKQRASKGTKTQAVAMHEPKLSRVHQKHP